MGTVAGTLTAAAILSGGHVRHHLTRDHFGTLLDSQVVLSVQIGAYPAGMDVHDVLLDMQSRLDNLSSTTYRIGSFQASAFIGWYLWANAVLFKTVGQSATADAFFARGGSFAASALLARYPIATFTINASVV